VELHGRPLSFYTDKAGLFQTAPKIARDQKELPRDEREPLPPTPIGRALAELGIVLDRGALAAGHGTGRTRFSHGAGSSGEGLGRGGGHSGTSQYVSGNRVPSLVEPHPKSSIPPVPTMRTVPWTRIIAWPRR